MEKWSIDNKNRISLEYFPFIDGEIGSFSYEISDSRFILHILREDLGEICVFECLEVERYAFDLRGQDIVSDAEIFDISDCRPEIRRDSLHETWQFLYGNYSKESAIDFLERRVSSKNQGYVLDISGNMGGRIVLLFKEMRLTLEKVILSD